MPSRDILAKPARTVPARLLIGPARHWWRMHPRLGLALRTAIAGGLAWLLAQLLPTAEADRYAYFAPMGAVIVTSRTVVDTARELLRSVTALVLGCSLGLAALAVMQPSAVGVAVVIAVAVLLGGWKVLGPMSGWVPTVAIFTMVLGRGQPWSYVSAYTGLSALGAAIGVAVVALIPQLIITPLDEAVRRVWVEITLRIRQLRDDLRRTDGVGVVGTAELDRARLRLNERLAEVDSGRQINRRTRRHDVDGRIAQARSVSDLAARLQDFQRRLEDLGDEDGGDDRTELNTRLSDTLDVIYRSLRQGRSDDLEHSLEPALSSLDDVVHRTSTPGAGRHSISSLVNDLRKLGLAAGDTIRVSVRRSDDSDHQDG